MCRRNRFSWSFIPIVCIILAGCAAPVLNTQNAEISEVKTSVSRIAVMDFEFSRPEYEVIGFGNIRRPKNAGTLMADAFNESLMSMQIYELIERRRIIQLLDEKGLSLSGVLESGSLSQLSELLQVDGLVLGSVAEYCDYQSGLNWGADVEFSARLVDVRSGMLVWAVSARRNLGASNSGVTARAACNAAVADLLKKIRQ